jgi:multidrug efflux pump subunit AcrA (membrane-fusion protein)
VGLVVVYALNRPAAARPDVLLHTVKRESLNVTVTEKGTLESAENRDVICKVRAGTKGFATSINWVIDDGSKVKKGEPLMFLDDSSLQDQFRAQKIAVDTAYSAKVTADKLYEITVKEGERAVAAAENDVLLAQIDLEKYLGLTFEPAQSPLAAVIGVPAALTESGGYRQQLDDLTGQVSLAQGDYEQALERSAWAERMVKQKYYSPAQAQAERSKMESAGEKLRSLRTQRTLLIGYDRKRMLSDLRSKLENYQKMLAQKILEGDANRIKAEIDKSTKTSIWNNETEKLADISGQIKECRIEAPQDGMVVYFKNESNRFGGTPQNLIEQGAQVKEGQKMLRIPNLDRMQVNTKVHEAMVGRIKGDIRVPTHVLDVVQLEMINNLDPFFRLAGLAGRRDDLQKELHEHLAHAGIKETTLASRGQRATVHVDASGPEISYPAHVRSVAEVASQTDSFMSDVKVYQTLVLIEGRVEGLKPDMSAEVSIHVDGIKDILAVPLQAIIGGAEMGAKRKIFVKTPTGYAERDVTLGLYNEKVVEVRDGLTEGEEIVLNPKVLLGDSKAKTRDGDNTTKGGNGNKGDGSKGGAEEGGKKGGGDPTKKRKGGGGPPGGGPQG